MKKFTNLLQIKTRLRYFVSMMLIFISVFAVVTALLFYITHLGVRQHPTPQDIPYDTGGGLKHNPNGI
jgi:hypothetical protein